MPVFCPLDSDLYLQYISFILLILNYKSESLADVVLYSKILVTHVDSIKK